MSSRSDSEGAGRARGTIQRLYLERSFGFIKCRESDDPTHINVDYFFHVTNLDGCSIHELEEGGWAEFTPTDTAKGKRAEHVTRL